MPTQGARLLALLATVLLSSLPCAADGARFDLTGPKIDVRITRGGSVLPIAQVPNLQPGDRIWVHPDLPRTQSVHLLVIVCFLRGTTNPPPDNWFTRIEAWDKKARTEGVFVTVPEEAQSALIFVAPETGGDFSTLKSAVRGRPGIFVRAAADLNEASFEQSRIEHYLEAMRTVSPTDPKVIADRSAKLAATLNLKPNADCAKQPVDQQVACLRQTGAQMLLDDGHEQTIASSLSSGASSDFINAASVTPVAGAGLYSAYVGAVVDLMRLLSGLHTAQYQYIPAISFPQDQTLNLKLNAAPSFHNPKSVIVIGLPAIQAATLPPLRPHDPNQVSCLLQPHMVLPLEGAPLVFATAFAHDLVLRIQEASGPRDLPLKADDFEGGLVVDNTPRRKPLHPIDIQSGNISASRETKPAPDGLTVTGTVHGYWGFDTFDGPAVTLQQIEGKDWQIVGNTQLLAGTENHITLKGTGTACVEHISLLSNSKNAHSISVDFQPAPPPIEGVEAAKNRLDLKVPLQKVNPGGYKLQIKQFGPDSETTLPLTAYTNAIRIQSLHIHAGDHTATLEGSALKDVESVEIAGERFTPTAESSDSTLQLTAKNSITPGEHAVAHATLHDGRTMKVDVTVEAPRPGLKLLSLSASPVFADGTMPIALTSKKDVPLSGKLTFVVQSEKGFPRSEKIEAAIADGSLHTTLSLNDTSLILQDEHTAIGTLDPLKAFGPSAFGKLQMRPVADNGTQGDWTDLGMLVRTPVIQSLECVAGAAMCTLTGSNLFLLESVSATQDFAKPTTIPTGFAGDTLQVPIPTDGLTLYLKLRDDPSEPATIKLKEAIAQPEATKPDAANAPPEQTPTEAKPAPSPASPPI